MIKTIGLNKTYKSGNGTINVINNTNIELPSTGLVTFFGKSGSGKTTLLNVIGGLDKAKGKLVYDDITFNNYKMGKMDKYRAKNIGYIFQNYNLIKDESVYNNLLDALEIYGVTDKEECKKRIEYSLKSVGLYKFRKKPCYALSGGQMQRVAIARCLIKNNKIIIADEPTGNLDSKNSVEIMKILKKLSKTCLVILVTHSPEFAQYYSDVVFEIQDGKVVNRKERSEDATLTLEDESTIYLKDLEEVSVDSNNVKTTIYSSNNTDKINIELVEKNGTYYVKSNVKLRLLEGSKITLVDDHKREITSETEDETSFDTSWYNDSLKANYKRRFLINLRSGYAYFKSQGRRTRILNIIFVLIGALMCVANSEFISSKYVDTSNVVYEDDLYNIKCKDELNTSDFYNRIIELCESGKVIDYTPSYRNSYTLDVLSTSYKKVSREVNAQYLAYAACDGYNLYKGEAPKSNECVIGYILAKSISETLDVKMDILIGAKLSNYTISGITTKNSNCVYLESSRHSSGSHYFSSELVVCDKDVYNDFSDIAEVTKYEEFQINQLKIINKNKQKTATIMLIALVAICAIYIFFTMRSKMISDIYDIGVLRSIGQSRSSIVFKSSIEIIIRTVFTTLLGYLITTFVYGVIVNKLHKVNPSVLTLFDKSSTWLFVIGIFGMNLVFGLIPIMSLLRKTPAEIISKYDI